MKTKASSHEQIQKLSREMLALANRGEWAKLAEVEQTRESLFYSVFSDMDSHNAALGREILAIDKKIMTLARAAMSNVQQDAQKLRDAGKANNAYQAIQALGTGGS
jgi:hypothetical protein